MTYAKITHPVSHIGLAQLILKSPGFTRRSCLQEEVLRLLDGETSRLGEPL